MNTKTGIRSGLKINIVFLLLNYAHLNARLRAFQRHELIIIHFVLNGDASMVLVADDEVRRVTACSRQMGRRAPWATSNPPHPTAVTTGGPIWGWPQRRAARPTISTLSMSPPTAQCSEDCPSTTIIIRSTAPRGHTQQTLTTTLLGDPPAAPVRGTISREHLTATSRPIPTTTTITITWVVGHITRLPSQVRSTHKTQWWCHHGEPTTVPDSKGPLPTVS